MCDPVANKGCEDGLVCEAVTLGADPICTTPVVVRGKVFALPGTTGIAGARVVALDVNGAAVSSVAVSGTDGTYELRVPSERNADATVIGQNVTLRADAPGYLSFPSGIRTALPIDTRSGTLLEEKLVITSALTGIGLIASPGGGTGSIAGKVAVPETRPGILVVAEGGAGPGVTAIADRDGDYKIFNLTPGAYTVKAYAKGANHDPAMITVAANATATADLKLSTRPASSVTGSIGIVNPEMGSDTSVILVVESTFNDTLARGETPAGLRVGNITGTFTIAGVPEGKYVVLAGFENDLLVRDPDTGIGGTEIVHIQVASGADTAAGSSFKVTGARATLGPGRDAPEMVTSPPTLSWSDDSSEDEYHVMVFDALGAKVWEKVVPRETSRDPSVLYDGPFASGMYYQFKALSMRNKGGGLRPISATEDLRGVFYKP